MNSTVAVAAMGFIVALAGTWLNVRLQHRSDRDGRILDAQLRVYAGCSDSLIEFARATYNRVKARLQEQSESEREGLRQESYRCSARARSAIAQVYILSGNRTLQERLSKVHSAIGELNKASGYADLRHRQAALHAHLDETLEFVRENLAP